MSFLTERYYQILSKHQLYHAIADVRGLKYFMERHVICMWSYNSLIKSLYQDIARVALPLNSSVYKNALRLISQIMLGEEVEDLGDGYLASHLELYLDAMQDLECDTSSVFAFFDLIEKGMPLAKAAKLANFSSEVNCYLGQTIHNLSQPAHVKAALLYFEAEPFVPENFYEDLAEMTRKNGFPFCSEYFERLGDGCRDNNLSLMHALAESLCLSDKDLKEEAEKACEALLGEKVRLWNGISHSLADQNEAHFVEPRRKIFPPHLRLVT
ncbi:MAG: DUF3050 domain-containing protein [Oligoflexales bacterium]